MSMSFELHTIGARHKSAGQPYQDYAVAFDGQGYSLISVCDGHGGGDYFRSDRGSRLAAEIFARCFAQWYEEFKNEMTGAGGGHSSLEVFSDDFRLVGLSKKDSDEYFRYFIRYFIDRWRRAVEEDVRKDPFRIDEMKRVTPAAQSVYLNGESIYTAYGTTFIGAVMTINYCFGFQIGDGDLLCFGEDGRYLRAVEPDPECIGNLTTSLCADNACDKARTFLLSREKGDMPAAVFASSDGLANSFCDEKYFAAYFGGLLGEMKKSGYGHALKEYGDFLPELSAEGSGDDITIAGIVRW